MEPRSTVLLIEDNPDDVLLFQRALRMGQQDYDVHVATSGQEAIDYLQRAGQGSEVQHRKNEKVFCDDSRGG